MDVGNVDPLLYLNYTHVFLNLNVKQKSLCVKLHIKLNEQ